MLARCTWVVLVGAAAAAPAPGADDPKAELKKFQGAWSLTSAEQNGVQGDRAQLAEVKWVWEGESCTVKVGTALKEHRTTLGPDKGPKAIDLLVTAGPGKGETSRGIYRFLDDELVLCFPTDTKAARPKEFTGKAGSGQLLLTLKRKKG
jgi:uncharacterized protein (TIGR03067 family)